MHRQVPKEPKCVILRKTPYASWSTKEKKEKNPVHQNHP